MKTDRLSLSCSGNMRAIMITDNISFYIIVLGNTLTL